MRRRTVSDPFSGPLAPEFEAFLAFRRDLGTYDPHLRVRLQHLDRFLAQRAPEARELTGSLLDEWLATLTERTAITCRHYFLIARQFCLFRARADPTRFIPDPRCGPRATVRFRPYIYSEGEIRALVNAAADLTGGLRPHTYVTLLLVLYTTGLRIGEALHLRLGDFDHGQRLLHVRVGKFRKSRLVPITASLVARLEAYLERRSLARAPVDPEAALFWSPRGGHYSLVGIQCGISNLLRLVCRKPPGRSRGPRVHDLRHTFAVHRLLRWYREGADVQAKLPLLATYLGHRSFLSTQVYLTATPELLAEASRRFHDGFGSVIHVLEDSYDLT